MAAGSVQTSAGEILLRVKARKQWADEFAGIEIVAGREGPLVTLGDIATIRDDLTSNHLTIYLSP